VNVDVRYDPERQLLYVRLKWPHGPLVETEDFGGDRYVDYDDSGDVVGIEFLAIGEDGVNLEGLPEADRVEEAIESIQRLVVAR